MPLTQLPIFRRTAPVMLLTVLVACAQSVSFAAEPGARSTERGTVPTLAGLPHTAAVGLSTKQLEQLLSLGIKVAVPTRVPPGFAVEKVEAGIDPWAGPGGSPVYTIFYREPGGTCFAIESSSGGFGGPVPENSRPLDLPSLPLIAASEGYQYQLFWTDKRTGEPPFPDPVVFSDWLQGQDSFYRLSSGVLDRQGCRSISPETALQLVASFQYLRP